MIPCGHGKKARVQRSGTLYYPCFFKVGQQGAEPAYLGNLFCCFAAGIPQSWYHQPDAVCSKSLVFLFDYFRKKSGPSLQATAPERCAVGDIQLQDLFSSTEMEKLMQRKERFQMATLRNRVVISLLIYQGLRLAEITRIRLRDIDLESGSIYLRAMIRTATRTTARTLTLKPNQVMLQHDYIQDVIPDIFFN